jgi:hypothetical protein
LRLEKQKGNVSYFPFLLERRVERRNRCLSDRNENGLKPFLPDVNKMEEYRFGVFSPPNGVWQTILSFLPSIINEVKVNRLLYEFLCQSDMEACDVRNLFQFCPSIRLREEINFQLAIVHDHVTRVGRLPARLKIKRRAAIFNYKHITNIRYVAFCLIRSDLCLLVKKQILRRCEAVMLDFRHRRLIKAVKKHFTANFG